MENRMTAAKIEQFHAKLIEDEKSDATIQKYIRDINKFYLFVGDCIVTKEIAVKYKQKLTEEYKPTSVNSMLAALNRFFWEMGWLNCIIKTLKIQRQAFRPKEKELSKAEYLRLLNAAKEQGNTRLYLLLETLCSTGIRVSELHFITVEAIKLGRAQVNLKGKTRTVLLTSALCRELKRYIREKRLRTAVFL